MRKSISKKQLRQFGFILGFGFPIIIGWLIPAITGHLFRSWSLWVGCPALILGILKPSLLSYPYKIWIAICIALGWINSKLILGLVYLIILLDLTYTTRTVYLTMLNILSSYILIFGK